MRTIDAFNNNNNNNKNRLQQPVQNPISVNTNLLWNSPSLGKITAIGYPWFYKTTPFLSFKGKKTGSNSSIFFWYRTIFGMGKKNSTTNHFFSFNLCPIGNTLTYSVQYYPVVTFEPIANIHANLSIFHIPYSKKT